MQDFKGQKQIFFKPKMEMLFCKLLKILKIFGIKIQIIFDFQEIHYQVLQNKIDA